MFAEPDPTPGYKRLLVYADEAGTTGQTYSGFGSLWMPWERRGDFQKLLRTQREAHGYTGSFAANTTPSALLTDLVDEMFRRRWLSFRCVITPTTDDETRRRAALVAMIARRAKPPPKPLTPPDPEEPAFLTDHAPAAADVRLRLTKAARIADATRTKPQAAIATALAALLVPEQPLSVRAARTVEGVELAELLTALVVSGWERRYAGKDRKYVAERVAENLGWGDLAADTVADEWKFNIWFVKDPAQLDGSTRTQRAVQLLLPMTD